MAVTRYEPWSVFNQLSNELNRMFEQRPPRSTDEHGNVVASDWVPAVDIKEEDQQFVICADIPGVDPKDIDVHMEQGILSISGQREAETKEESFLRRFSLPDTADAEKISAKCKNGVLEVVIPKHERLQPRKISVEE
ncbi:MAG: Hsp20/alpha crystallin family protein [Gammaproteobacteria bacterium]